MSADDQHSTTPLRLQATRSLTRAAIVVERLWPLALPVVIVTSVFLSLSWLGVFRSVPDWARLGLLSVLSILWVASLYPLRFYSSPRPGDVDRRIERANKLVHAPVITQQDRLSLGPDSAFAQALWREHQKRMAARLNGLAADLPHSQLPERDPWGLRAAIALLLVVAFAFSFGPLGGRLGDGFHSHSTTAAVTARIDAWVTPPAHTGRAPVYLTADANREADVFRVPQDSEITLRVTGGAGGERLVYLGAHDGVEADVPLVETVEPTRPGAQDASQFGGRLSQDGLLTLRSGESEIARWAFNVIPDNAPTIGFVDEPRRALNGALDLRYEVLDDYGVARADAVFEQADEAADARPLYDAPEMQLSLPRASADPAGTARTSRDLTEHPWAGSKLALTLRAVDAAGQEGTSETVTFVLPERPFTNPLARALVEQRRLLALDANARPRVLALMEAITLRPDDTIPNLSHYLGIKVAESRLRGATDDDALRDVADYLWEMALLIEDGNLSAAERRLREAQEALQQALQDGASDEEIEELMAELREAMAEFMRELAERAMRNPDAAQQQMPMDGEMIRQSDLERMLDQIENLARSGAREEAQDLLSQLQDMMNNLQAQQQQQMAPGQGQQDPMRQQMDELGQLMQRQQQMMNETFGLQQQQRRLQQQQQQGQQPGGEDGQPMTPEEFAEAMRQLQEQQSQLRDDLQALSEALEGMGLEPAEGFGEAGEAMGRAEGALGDQQGERAVGEQGQALEALRRGAQDMMQQMQEAMQGDQGGNQPNGRQQGADRDPLGRPRATTGPDFGDTVRVPDEADIQRAREILEEIRRRLGNTLSPQIERNYLERLLELR